MSVSGEGHSRQKNNACTALKWKYNMVPCGWRTMSEEEWNRMKLERWWSQSIATRALANNLYVDSLQAYPGF